MNDTTPKSNQKFPVPGQRTLYDPFPVPIRYQVRNYISQEHSQNRRRPGKSIGILAHLNDSSSRSQLGSRRNSWVWFATFEDERARVVVVALAGLAELASNAIVPFAALMVRKTEAEWEKVVRRQASDEDGWDDTVLCDEMTRT